MLHRFAVALAAVAWSAPAFAHEGDPKVLDLRPPYQGPGFRSGRPTVLREGQAAIAAPEFAASGVELLSWLPLGELAGGSSGNSCYGYTSPSGRSYALMGLRGGTSVVEVTDPGDPQIVAFVPGPVSLWRDVRTYQNYMYTVSEGGQGIQVISLAQVDAGSVTLVGTVQTGGSTSTHTLCIDQTSGFLYRSGGEQNGLRIYSLANPANPALVATWNDRYVHEVSVFTYPAGTAYAGKQIAICCGGFNSGWTNTGVSILDVTNKSNIQVLKHFSYPGAAYCHQAWPSTDYKTLYINDELDENGSNFTSTKVIDITNLSNPVVKTPFQNQSTAIGHNLYVKSNRIYEANYRSGLRVFDNTNPLQPTEVAWFDTWPEDDEAHFNGLWNVYPYFPSGIVIGSDIDRGLFVWWVGAPLIDFDYPGGAPAVLSPSGQQLTVTLNQSAPGTLVPGSQELHYDAGAGWQSVPLASQGGNQYAASFPALPCGETVKWYVSARSTNGITWTDPQGGPLLYHSSIAALGHSVVASDDLESPDDWTSGMPGDTATSGEWLFVAPYGSIAAPDLDHTGGLGSKCATTGQGINGSTPASQDLDGGTTSLVSPPFDASGLSDPWVSYWRWFSNDKGTAPGESGDVLRVLVSSSAAGGPWTEVEVVGPTGPEVSAGWLQHTFRLADYVAPSSTLRLLFVASDLGAESLVEAAVDDLEVFDMVCPPSDPDTYCTPKPNSLTCLPHMTWEGVPSATSPAAFDLRASEVLSQKPGLLFYGFSQSSVPFQGGVLCVTPPVTRTPGQSSGSNPPIEDCSGQFSMDFNDWIQTSGDPGLTPGAVVYTQYWSRDPGDPAGFGTSLSDALRFTIQP
jgi:choice-of-anchor B domain-containing protein